ncbi:E3 ubiquitin-protein ligase TRIM37-like [Selaginella moellendorffii]|uniref:E3 ubiquitin-protein ligase TRIM37-like n=1 Tax=Selaginella moellendorffii TaxID=88036 RepID=UPI000D1C96DB|nr:E3 ubiquitin-protein ligase TRIM37-like [Selaginella moellendorffii]|eukprot:XP_024516254.1 E3 ubiquitin-protein ligase TRIM37-like [Selaginella moellendorffii]
MVKGGSEPTTYEYGIEMLHRSQPHMKVVRRFSSDFEEGACWGYYQFFKIDDLENEGYLLPGEDTLTLSFYVRAQTFLQQCLDLRRALSSCQAERQEAVTQVAVLRRAFASSIWQQRRRKNGSVSELEDNQGSIKQVLAGAVSSLLPTFEQPNPKAARDTFSRLDKILLSGVPTSDAPQKSEVDDRSDAPSMALSQASVQPESREKCELWLKSRDNLFQMPASRSKFYGRRGHRHRKSNRAFDVVSLAKRTRMATLPCAILEGNDESVNT